MTSDQKYEGKGNNAQSNERTANIEPQTPATQAKERFVIEPETLVMQDTETGDRFEFLAQSTINHASALEGDHQTLFVLLTIVTCRVFSAAGVSEEGIKELEQYHDLVKEWLLLYGADFANDPIIVRAALIIARELDELANDLTTTLDVESILAYLQDTISDLRKEVSGE